MINYDTTDLPPQILAELTAWTEPDFTCACCNQLIICRWNPRGWGRQIPPVCNDCERVSGFDWTGRPRLRGWPSGGSYMDRRNAVRILALADNLAALANRIEWSQRHEA